MKPLASLVLLAVCSLASAEVHLDRLNLPSGLSIRVLTDDVPNARQMALSADEKTLFVGTRRKGDVYRVTLDGEGNATEVVTLLEGLTMPSGLALRTSGDREDLYVGALNEVWVVRDAANQNSARLLTDDLPRERHHGWKYLRFGPDGALYLPVGAPCNICLSKDPRFASVLKMDPDTGSTEVYASGVRNSVGLAFHPQSGELWFTDNGRDMMGDDVPPEEINVAPSPGLHFGYPFYHANQIVDPKFGNQAPEQPYTTPVHALQAHSAALGLTFNTGSALGEAWQNTLIVAEHGSWNRSKKVGYRVAALHLDGPDKGTYVPLVTGWLEGQKNWGRPNDVLMTRAGHLLISDDQGGVIYMVSTASAASERRNSSTDGNSKTADVAKPKRMDTAFAR